MIFGHTVSHIKEVFLLFLIPVGGGIPAGVVVAHKFEFSVPLMMLLYLVSDIVQALIFEPITWIFGWLGSRIYWLGNFLKVLRASVVKSTGRYGVKPGPLTLILISFGVDPLTGRTAALIAGHGFLVGWTFAIIGDMFFFALIMASTLWLSNILGDGTWAALIVMLAMFCGPALVRGVRRILGASRD